MRWVSFVISTEKDTSYGLPESVIMSERGKGDFRETNNGPEHRESECEKCVITIKHGT